LWHNVSAKFHENRSFSSKIERDTRTRNTMGISQTFVFRFKEEKKSKNEILA